jgi:hypothetical protein
MASCEGIRLAQDGNQWRTLLYTTMNLGFYNLRGITGLAEEFAAWEGLRSAELTELDYWRRREIYRLKRPERLFGPTNHLFRGILRTKQPKSEADHLPAFSDSSLRLQGQFDIFSLTVYKVLQTSGRLWKVYHQSFRDKRGSHEHSFIYQKSVVSSHTQHLSLHCFLYKQSVKVTLTK